MQVRWINKAYIWKNQRSQKPCSWFNQKATWEPCLLPLSINIFYIFLLYILSHMHHVDIKKLNEWTLSHILLFIKEVMIWTFVAINLSCMLRAKLLSKSFIASSLRLSCLRTNNRLSLGKLMHTKCIYFSKPFANCFDLESCHTSNKNCRIWRCF